jgi:hypothetical protein
MIERRTRAWERFPHRLVGLWILALAFGPVLKGLEQEQSSTVRLSTMEDESIAITLDKQVYLPGDTVRLSLRREDKASTSVITPVIAIEGMRLRPSDRENFVGILPLTVTPRSYRILLRIVEADGRRFVYETGRTLDVEEIQSVADLSEFVSIFPFDGATEVRSALTLDRSQLQSLQIVFRRKSIRDGMGPQFVTVKTTVLQRDGTTAQSTERRVMTFRSHGTAERDRAMFNQYRTAYGAYAAISPAELDRVLLPLDSLPAWATVTVVVTPDYTIKIGAYDAANSLTRHYRVRGPLFEVGFLLGIPKILYDSRANDTIEYGNTSAMMRLYYVRPGTGDRFPVSLGVGMFGVNSPIDVGVARGGFAGSLFLDLIELLHTVDVTFLKKVNIGIEVSSFFSIKKKSRLLLDAQVSFPI